jgi:hypothetical protein
VVEKPFLRRQDTSPPPTITAGEHTNPRLLPGSLALCSVGLGKRTPIPIRFGKF